MRSPWPWAIPDFPSVVQPTGDIAAAIALGVARDVGELRERTAGLVFGLARVGGLKPRWTSHGPLKCELSIDQPLCRMSQTFHLTVQGSIEVEFGVLALASHVQGRGVATELLKSALIQYDLIGVTHIVA